MASTSASASKQNTIDSLLDVKTFIKTTIPIRDRDPETTKLLDNLLAIYESHIEEIPEESCETMTPIITEVYSINPEQHLNTGDTPGALNLLTTL